MARPRKKPGFDPEKEIEGLISRVVSEYGTYDDRTCSGRPQHAPSLNEVARSSGLNIMKVRKLLITAGAYSTETSRLVERLRSSGASIQEIMEKTGLSRPSVTSYLPYEKTVYKPDEASLNAGRMKRYHSRKRAVEEFAENMSSDNYIDWNENERLRKALVLFEGYYFQLEDGRRYRYTIDSRGLHFTGTDDEATWDDVGRALGSAAEPGGMKGRKADYLYPVFQRLGINCRARKE